MYYVTGRCGIKAVPNDQCGSVRKVLSVRRRRPRFARPPGAFGPTPADSLRSSADRGSSRSAFDPDGRDVLTHTIKSEDLTPFLRNWSFGIKGVLQRPAVKDISRKSPCEFFFSHKYVHTYVCMYVCMYVCTCIHTYPLYYKSCVRCMSLFGTAARSATKREVPEVI